MSGAHRRDGLSHVSFLGSTDGSSECACATEWEGVEGDGHGGTGLPGLSATDTETGSNGHT
eukprot:5423723-Lingulodinium_polyedra.AAC.1